MFPTPDFVRRLSGDLQRDLFAFLPELLLCATIVLMLLVRLVGALNRAHMAELALGMAMLALASALWFWPEAWSTEGPVPTVGGKAGFSGLVVFDKFGLFVRIFLLAFLCLSLWLSLLTGLPDREDSADYSTLLVGGTLGMMLMVSANHLLTAFLAVEMASVPSYVLAGFLKGRRQGSEAALKYVVYRARVGVMLYGISLITASTARNCRQSPGPLRALKRRCLCRSSSERFASLLVWVSSSRRSRSTFGAPTCSRALRRRLGHSCRSHPRRPPWP